MHVDRRNDSVNIENSAIIVNRSNHPALLEGLSFMHSKVDAHPYYDGLGKGVKKYLILHHYIIIIIFVTLLSLTTLI